MYNNWPSTLAASSDAKSLQMPSKNVIEKKVEIVCVPYEWYCLCFKTKD